MSPHKKRKKGIKKVFLKTGDYVYHGTYNPRNDIAINPRVIPGAVNGNAFWVAPTFEDATSFGNIIYKFRITDGVGFNKTKPIHNIGHLGVKKKGIAFLEFVEEIYIKLFEDIRPAGDLDILHNYTNLGIYNHGNKSIILEPDYNDLENQASQLISMFTVKSLEATSNGKHVEFAESWLASRFGEQINVVVKDKHAKLLGEFMEFIGLNAMRALGIKKLNPAPGSLEYLISKS